MRGQAEKPPRCVVVKPDGLLRWVERALVRQGVALKELKAHVIERIKVAFASGVRFFGLTMCFTPIQLSRRFHSLNLPDNLVVGVQAEDVVVGCVEVRPVLPVGVVWSGVGARSDDSTSAFARNLLANLQIAKFQYFAWLNHGKALGLRNHDLNSRSLVGLFKTSNCTPPPPPLPPKLLLGKIVMSPADVARICTPAGTFTSVM